MKWYTAVVLSATVLSAAGLAIIAFKQDPLEAGGFIKFLFFCSLFVLSWGVGTLISFYFRKDFSGAFRRGLWLAVLALGAIGLNRLGLLNILNFSILLGVIAGVEWFLSKTFNKKEEWT